MLVIVISTIASINIFAQREFKNYFQYKELAKKWNQELCMNIGIPQGFHISEFDPINDNPLREPKSFCIKAEEAPGGVVFSENKDIMIFYPCIEMQLWPYQQKIADMEYQKGIMHLCKYLETSLHTPAKHKVLTHTKLCGHADSIIISQQAIDTPNVLKYTSVTSIYIKKEHYIPLYFRVFFNNVSKQNADKVVGKLLNVIRYNKVSNYKALKENYQKYTTIDFEKKEKQNSFYPIGTRCPSQMFSQEIEISKTDSPARQDTISISSIELHKNYIRIIPNNSPNTYWLNRNCEHFNESAELLEFALLNNRYVAIRVNSTREDKSSISSIKLIENK